MKKITFLLALLAVFGLAQADVGVFGTLDAGYNVTKLPGAQTSNTAFQSGGMTTSFVGINGKEDLGNGNKAFFEVSSYLNLGNGATIGGQSQNSFARSAFVGLANNTFGTLTIGRQYSPSYRPLTAFNAYGESETYSPLLHATYFGNTGNPTVLLYNDTGWDNSVAYTTPNVSGVTVTVQDARNGLGAHNDGVNAIYSANGLGLMAYYQKTEFASSNGYPVDLFAGSRPATAKGLGASYDLKVAKVFATWQDATDKALSLSGKTTQVSALVPVGAGNVMAEYAHSNFGPVKYNEYAIGYDYNLSKRTDVYATAGRTNVTALTAGQTLGAGLRVRF